MDGELQNNQSARHFRLHFGSPEYFNFAANNQGALPWLALGRNVQFVWNGAIYEIYD